LHKLAESEREQAKEFLIALIIPWLFFCGFSVALIEHATILTWIVMIFMWGYPIFSFIAFKISELFYQQEKYSIGRWIMWSPIWFPFLLGVISGFLK
jgi:hypothetical protein